jgi:hypothetical protein
MRYFTYTLLYLVSVIDVKQRAGHKDTEHRERSKNFHHQHTN